MSELLKTAAGLPLFCFILDPVPAAPGKSRPILRVQRGETGYYRTQLEPAPGETPEAAVDRFNAQREAMAAGSLFGWYTPAANPDLYDEAGHLNPAKVRALPGMPDHLKG